MLPDGQDCDVGTWPTPQRGPVWEAGELRPAGCGKGAQGRSAVPAKLSPRCPCSCPLCPLTSANRADKRSPWAAHLLTGTHAPLTDNHPQVWGIQASRCPETRGWARAQGQQRRGSVTAPPEGCLPSTCPPHGQRSHQPVGGTSSAQQAVPGRLPTLESRLVTKIVQHTSLHQHSVQFQGKHQS